MTDALATPSAPPDLKIPGSDSTVKVSCIDSTTYLKLPMSPFLQPDYAGKEYLTGPAFSFLIEHPSGTKILFDLGTRKDWRNLPSVIVDRITQGGWEVTVQQNVADILASNNVSPSSISAVVWSHHHWDHVGDMSTFPKTTDLVIGPGFRAAYLPGWPGNKDSPVTASDFEVRTVTEVDFAPKPGQDELKIGRFKAHDYFGDGSFYLLDTPGHSTGHMCGLARTTGGAGGSFVFMGGDACHHGGEFRPTPYLPLPREVGVSGERAVRRLGPVCPGELLVDIHRSKKATEPYYLVTEKFASDLEAANWTIDGVEEFDAQENVFVLIAHDDSVLGHLDLYPREMNDWYQKGLAKEVKWTFLEDFVEGVKK